MAFRFAQQGRAYWPVTLRMRTEDGGIEEGDARIGYQLLTRAALRDRDNRVLLAAAEKVSQKLAAGAGADDIRVMLEQRSKADDDRVQDLADRIFDWRDITDVEGQPLAFDRAVLDAMLADPMTCADLDAGLVEASLGAVRKNSLPGPAGAPEPTPT